MKPGQDLELINDFSCSYHGSGPVDSLSKDARHEMDSDVAAGKFVRYNYEHCYEWCIQNMAAPEGKKSIAEHSEPTAIIFGAHIRTGMTPTRKDFL